MVSNAILKSRGEISSLGELRPIIDRGADIG
jgi:hypothetical protein